MIKLLFLRRFYDVFLRSSLKMGMHMHMVRIARIMEHMLQLFRRIPFILPEPFLSRNIEAIIIYFGEFVNTFQR